MNAAVAVQEYDPLKDRILERSSRTTLMSCWEWVGPRSSDGRYGRARGLGEQLAHRLSYRLWRGEIPDGLTIDHLCGNTLCVNPWHLEPVTLRENILRSNGITARQARQTHCKHGHEFTAANTYVFPSGRRSCRLCRADLRRRHYMETGR